MNAVADRAAAASPASLPSPALARRLADLCSDERHVQVDFLAAPPAEPASPASRAIPMEVRREVWERDGGRCAWTSADGKRCGSTWRLEFGHLRPFALGGRATKDNVRLECGQHNQYEAERVFGREHMARYRATSSSGSDPR